MKLLYKNMNINNMILIVMVNLLLVSCGTYQSVYNNDGIYGDELSWIIIYMDNQALIDRNGGIIYPGMTFQLRKNLDPCE